LLMGPEVPNQKAVDLQPAWLNGFPRKARLPRSGIQKETRCPAHSWQGDVELCGNERRLDLRRPILEGRMPVEISYV
jgi:hypothetical protein